MSNKKKTKKIRKLEGTVMSDKMAKTVVVAVERMKRHPVYGKYYKITTRYKAHDEKGEHKIGDKVVIQESRPLSKDKRWKVVRRI